MANPLKSSAQKRKKKKQLEGCAVIRAKQRVFQNGRRGQEL